MSTDPTIRAYTVPEFMRAYSVSRARTYEEINAGRLVARRLGGRTLITRAEAEAWMMGLPAIRTVPTGEDS